jgi:hypothetical protein
MALKAPLDKPKPSQAISMLQLLEVEIMRLGLHIVEFEDHGKPIPSMIKEAEF